MGSLLPFLLTTWMLGWLYGRVSRQGSAVPLLLMPRLRQLALIFGVGTLLPIGLYFVFTRFSGVSGREYSLVPTKFAAGSGALPGILFLAEVSALILAVVLLTGWLAKRQVRRRCLELHVPVPPAFWSKTGHAFKAGLISAAMVLFTFGFLITLGTGIWMENPNGNALVLGGALSLVALLATLLPLPALWRAARKQQEYSLYYASLYRSRAPIIAALIILLALLQPLLSGYEYWLVRHDPLTTRLTLETDVVKEIKSVVNAEPIEP